MNDNGKLTPQIGLALGGGGVRGLAHVGVLKALDAASVTVSHVAGTSMGAVIGALYAAGVSVTQIEDIVLATAARRSLRGLLDIKLSYRGFLSGERIIDLLRDVIGPELTFADLQLPLAVVATDARSGKEVVLHDGNVADAVRASISVPGIFHPVERDNLILIDGGILNNVPVNVARTLGAQPVIAVDVMPDFSRNTPGEELVEPPIDPPSLPGFLQETLHIEYIMISALTNCRLLLDPPDVLIRPEVPADIDLLIGFERAAEVMALGEAAAREALPQISAVLES